MRSLARTGYLTGIALTVCAGLGLLLPGPAGASAAGGHAEDVIVSFRYQPIIAAARESLAVPTVGSGAADANPANADAIPNSSVSSYLAMSGSAFAAEKRAVLAQYPGVSVVEDFPMLPVALVRVANPAAVGALEANPEVLSVTPNTVYTVSSVSAASTADATPAPADLSLIDDIQAQAAGDLGEGTVAAVLDNGTDYTNPAFGTCTKIGSSTCSVLAYKDFAAPPASGLSFDGHGTNVAGQVLKVAPAAKLVIGNVFHSTGSGTKNGASTSDILGGLSWVLGQDAKDSVKYAFRAVNLSLGVAFSYNSTACTGSPYTGVFSQLLAANVQPVVAAGNTAYDGNIYKTGVSDTACTPGALVVGAVYTKNEGPKTWDQTFSTGQTSDCADLITAAGMLACFTQDGPLLNILAPGVYENAAGIIDTGTSQATPLVTGAIAAIASGALSQSAAEITAALIANGKSTKDPRTNTTVPLLDVYAAEKQSYGDAIIKSGNVGMGIAQWGDLNVPGQAPSAQGTTTYGLRYLPTNNEFTGPGCPCEGWGVADTVTGVDGYADESTGDAGQTLVSFRHTATTATSTVTIGSAIQATNAYSPVTGVPDLFQDQVVIKNISDAGLANVVYRRLVDWDMEPTAFDEYVTVEGFGNSPALVATTNDGFDSADPLSPSDNIGATGNFILFGPKDQGAQFDFDFGKLAAGAELTFTEYYGAAASQAQAYTDLAKVKVEAYSLGEPSSSTDGTPNTAMLGFADIGGTPLTFPPTP
jgi:Subtilase family